MFGIDRALSAFAGAVKAGFKRLLDRMFREAAEEWAAEKEFDAKAFEASLYESLDVEVKPESNGRRRLVSSKTKR